MSQFWEQVQLACGVKRNAAQQEAAADVVQVLAIGFASMATFTFITQAVLKIKAPYGRFTKEGEQWPIIGKLWAYPVPAQWGWFIQEAPSFLVPFYFLVRNWPEDFSVFPELNRVVLSYMLIHYFNRTFIYPYRIVGGKPSGLSTVMLAFLFTLANGLMQALCLTQLDSYNLSLSQVQSEPLLTLRFGFGSLLWLIGFLINKQSDDTLRNLRKPGETGYKIPRGGLFEFVTAPHYFGETIEWLGFGIAGNHIGGFVFAYFSFCYLCSRAFQLHEWYLNKFDDYPPSRKAFFPFLF